MKRLSLSLLLALPLGMRAQPIVTPGQDSTVIRVTSPVLNSGVARGRPCKFSWVTAGPGAGRPVKARLVLTDPFGNVGGEAYPYLTLAPAGCTNSFTWIPPGDSLRFPSGTYWLRVESAEASDMRSIEQPQDFYFYLQPDS